MCDGNGDETAQDDGGGEQGLHQIADAPHGEAKAEDKAPAERVAGGFGDTARLLVQHPALGKSLALLMLFEEIVMVANTDGSKLNRLTTGNQNPTQIRWSRKKIGSSYLNLIYNTVQYLNFSKYGLFRSTLFSLNHILCCTR
mgnify:CR=1 FL=1